MESVLILLALFSINNSPAKRIHKINTGYPTGKGIIEYNTTLRGIGTHDIGNLLLMIDDVGGQEGWRYTHIWPKAWNIDHLYWNWLAIGYSETNVSDGWDFDWSTTPNGAIIITEPGVLADEQGYAQFNDTVNGIEVTQASYAWVDSAHEDYVIIKYRIVNTGNSTFSNLYAGHRSDFDVYGDHAGAPTDMSDFDHTRNLGYMWDVGYSTHVGVKLLEGTYRGYRNTGWYAYSDSTKYYALSTPGADPQTPCADDYCFWLSSGPHTLIPGDSIIIAFAFLGGNDLTDLQVNADSAQSKWNSLRVEEEKVGELIDIHYTTTIFSGPFTLPQGKTCKILDITGRHIHSLNPVPGIYFIQVDDKIVQKVVKIK